MRETWDVDCETLRTLPEHITGLVIDDQGDLIIVTDERTVGVMKEEIARVVADDDKEDFPCLDS